MARWVIWSQVLVAFLVLVASLADQGRVPHGLFPPQILLGLCFYANLVLPIVVIRACRREKRWSERLFVAIASVGLALATWFAFLPLVQ